MENGPHPIEVYPHARTAPFAQVNTKRLQQALNLCPFDVGADWIGKDCLQCFQMFAAQSHGAILRHYSQGSKSVLTPFCYEHGNPEPGLCERR